MTVTSVNPAAAAEERDKPLDEDTTHDILLRAAAACADDLIAEMLAATGRSPQAILALNAQRNQFKRLAGRLHANTRRRALAQLVAIRRQRTGAA